METLAANTGNTMSGPFEFVSSGNPLIRHKYKADPAAIVHNDTVYLYTGHDEAPAGVENYVMKDWLCFSSPDLKHWTEHEVPLRAGDFVWAKGDAFNSQVIYRDGNFFWYVAMTHESIPGKAIGVAVAGSPAGPFWDAQGSALITNDMIHAPRGSMNNLDPMVIIDNGQAYLFWGHSQCYLLPEAPFFGK